MKLSARNMLKGKIVEVKKGQTTAHVRIDPELHRDLSITNEAVTNPLAAGQPPMPCQGFRCRSRSIEVHTTVKLGSPRASLGGTPQLNRDSPRYIPRN